MNWLRKVYKVFTVVSISVISGLIVYIFLHGQYKSGTVNLTIEEREWIEANDGMIKIAADPDYAPIDFINKWGEHDGIAEDYFRLIEKKLDIRFKRITVKSWKELLEKAKNGEIDVVKCAVKTPERIEYLDFTQPYLNIPTVIISINNKNDSLELKDLKGKTVAITEGYYIHEYIKSNFNSIHIITAPDNKKLLELVSTTSAEFAISDLPTITYFVKKIGFSNLKITGETGIDYKLGIGVSKKIPVLHRILTKAIDSINDDEREGIVSRWISVEYNRYLYSSGILIAIITGFSVIISLIFLIALWNKSLQHLVTKRTEELEKYKSNLEVLVEERTKQLKAANLELSEAISNMKTLRGLLPICANCKKIRNDKGYWEQIENYIVDHSEADFSHSICPECAAKLYPGYSDK